MLNSTEYEIFLLINIKMPTTVGILTFMSGKNSILGLSEPKISHFLIYFYTYEHLKFHAQLSSSWKQFYNPGAWSIERSQGSRQGSTWILNVTFYP